MKEDYIFKVMESKIKLKGDPELNFYYNKVKKEIQDLRQENQRLREENKERKG